MSPWRRTPSPGPGLRRWSSPGARWLLAATLLLGQPTTALADPPSPPTRLVTLQCAGAGQKDLAYASGFAQTNHYQFTVHFELNGRLIQEDAHQQVYRIEAAHGELHFWGTAAEAYNSRPFDFFHYDDAREIIAEGINGQMIYSRTEDRILSVSLPLHASTSEVTPYHLEYFADRGAPLTRLYVRLPSQWDFDEAYDSCPSPRATFGRPLVTQQMEVGWDAGFQYDPDYPEDPHWRMVAHGAWVETVFTLDRIPSSVQLRLRHLSSANSEAPGGGFSPVHIFVNGQLFQRSFDPAAHHGGSHGFVIDAWDIAPRLRPGVNTVALELSDEAWTPYWISHLTVYAFTGDCRECAADDLVHVDTLDDENEPAHHTASFVDETSEVRARAERAAVVPRLILRRGLTFDVLLKGPRATLQNLEALGFEAKDLLVPETSPTVISVPVAPGPLRPEEWGAMPVGGMTLTPTGVYARRYRLQIPVTAPLGEYEFSVRYRTQAAGSPHQRAFPVPVVLLYNPWPCPAGPHDAVHLADDAERAEYVVEETGTTWGLLEVDLPLLPAMASPKDYPWSYRQFSSPHCLATLLTLGRGLTPDERRDPALFGRYLTGACHTYNPRRPSAPPGVLVGNWKGPFTAANDPTRWTGSAEILAQYAQTGAPVEFAQCWVYAGVLTSLLRAAGVPARQVTAYNSAHSHDNRTDTVDRFYYDGRLFEPGNPFWDGGDILVPGFTFQFWNKRTDGLWPFHVWCEAWMHRNFLSEWQVLDATPQQLSAHGNPSYWETGPAAQLAVWQNAGGLYDVDFVRHEVSAPVYRWEVDGWNSQWIWIAHLIPPTFWAPNPNQALAGNPILTRSHRHHREDITTLYKPPFAAALRAAAPAPTPGWRAQLEPPEAASFGQPLICRIQLTNAGPTSRTLRVVLSLAALATDGSTLALIPREFDATVTVPPDHAPTPTLTVTPTEYLPACRDSRLLEARLYVKDLVTGEVIIDEQRFALGHAGLNLAAPLVPLHQGESVPLLVTWTNTSGLTLPSVELRVTAGPNATLDPGEPLVAAQTELPPGGVLQIQTNLAGLSPGRLLIASRLLGPWVSGVGVGQTLQIGPPLTLSIQSVPGAPCQLSFPGFAGRSYRLESSPSAATPSWTPVSNPLEGANATLTLSVPPTDQAAFFRVRALAPWESVQELIPNGASMPSDPMPRRRRPPIRRDTSR